YLAATLALLHFLWLVKAPAIGRPLRYGAVLVLLLGSRIVFAQRRRAAPARARTAGGRRSCRGSSRGAVSVPVTTTPRAAAGPAPLARRTSARAGARRAGTDPRRRPSSHGRVPTPWRDSRANASEPAGPPGMWEACAPS